MEKFDGPDTTDQLYRVRQWVQNVEYLNRWMGEVEIDDG